jgi:hypothetical protein
MIIFLFYSIAARQTISHLYIALLFSVLLQYLLKGLAYILCGLRSALPLARARKPNNHIA